MKTLNEWREDKSVEEVEYSFMKLLENLVKESNLHEFDIEKMGVIGSKAPSIAGGVMPRWDRTREKLERLNLSMNRKAYLLLQAIDALKITREELMRIMRYILTKKVDGERLIPKTDELAPETEED